MLLSGSVPGDPYNAGAGSDPAPYTWQATAGTARLYPVQWRQGTTQKLHKHFTNTTQTPHKQHTNTKQIPLPDCSLFSGDKVQQYYSNYQTY